MGKKIHTHVEHIRHHKQDRAVYFSTLSSAEAVDVFEELSPVIQNDLLARIPLHTLVSLLDQFDLDRAEKYLRRITNARRRSAASIHLKQDLRDKATQFTHFHPKAAVDMVHFDYILMPGESTIAETADALDSHFEETGKLPEILVRKDGICIGEVPPGTLIRENNDREIRSFIHTITTIPYNTPLREIAAKFMTHGVQKVVVTDSDESVIGIVYAKDVRTLFEEKPAESLYDFAGVEEDERPFNSVSKKFTSRYKWLIINLATVFMAAAVIAYYKDILQEIAILAMYLPVVAGMGGNAGTQTLAVFVRGITLGEISFANAFPAIRNEVMAGILQGLFHGTLVAGIAIMLGHSVMLGIVVALAVIINLIVATLAGSLTPLVMKSLGKDPAVSSGIFLSTFTDVFGFASIFILASILLL